MNPKVFVSHASEDKSKFVEEFAKKLRSDGIDAWLDKWEMKGGDSLVDKIFEEGIKNADAIIVVLSKTSIQKPWVKEEMNAGFVKRIKEKTKLIPIVIDDCDVPESLKSTVWIRINDLSNYPDEYDEVKMSILGTTDKPALGNLPRHTFVDEMSYYNLNKIDSLIFNEACKNCFDTQTSHVNSSKLFEKIKEYDIPESEFYDSLEILDKHYYIDTLKVMGGKTPAFSITNYGLKTFASAIFDEYDDYEQSISLSIVNNKHRDSKIISGQLKIPHLLVTIILQDLADRGLIGIQKVMRGMILITNVDVELKRILRNLS